MSATWVIARTEVVRRFRDRTALLFGVLAPVVMAAIIGFAFGGGFSFHATFGVVDGDGSELSAGIADGLTGARGESPASFVRVGGADEARRLIADGSIDAALVIPPGFAASLQGGAPAPLSVIVSSDRRIAGQVMRSIADSLAARVSATVLAVSTAAATGPVDAARLSQLVSDAQRIELPVVVAEDAGARYSPVAYFGASMAMLFAFFTIGAGARGLLREEAEGTLVRLRAAPIRPDAVLAGKAAGVLLVGASAMITVWLVTTVVFGARWGDPLAVLVVILGVVVSVTGISMLVASLARTDAQATQYTSVVAFSLALLGGNFLSPGALPGLMSSLSRLTPNGWALPAFVRMGAADAGVVDVLTTVAVLVAMGAVTGAVGLCGLRRRLSA